MSIGCVEIYAEREEEGALPFSGILFVRPTALGMYAAGKGTKPELKDNDDLYVNTKSSTAPCWW